MKELHYSSPIAGVLEFHPEGVICASGGIVEVEHDPIIGGLDPEEDLWQ